LNWLNGNGRWRNGPVNRTNRTARSYKGSYKD
jgi:hypothetical protein